MSCRFLLVHLSLGAHQSFLCFWAFCCKILRSSYKHRFSRTAWSRFLTHDHSTLVPFDFFFLHQLYSITITLYNNNKRAKIILIITTHHRWTEETLTPPTFPKPFWPHLQVCCMGQWETSASTSLAATCQWQCVCDSCCQWQGHHVRIAPGIFGGASRGVAVTHGWGAWVSSVPILLQIHWCWRCWHWRCVCSTMS